jgi:hypothetical protein
MQMLLGNVGEWISDGSCSCIRSRSAPVCGHTHKYWYWRGRWRWRSYEYQKGVISTKLVGNKKKEGEQKGLAVHVHNPVVARR